MTFQDTIPLRCKQERDTLRAAFAVFAGELEAISSEREILVQEALQSFAKQAASKLHKTISQNFNHEVC